jgi:Serine protease inhibitor
MYVMVTLKFNVFIVVPKRLKRTAATNLVVDRPFLFFLLHRDTQLVLLAGKVQNPTQVP